MKSYKCKYCNNEGDRKSIRACIMTHRKTNKRHGVEYSKRDKSVITESMIGVNHD